MEVIISDSDRNAAFEDRVRFTHAQAIERLKQETWGINHLLDNGDGGWQSIDGKLQFVEPTYSIMAHINCEWCNYCTQRNIAYEAGIRYSECNPLIHLAKPEPYEPENK